MNVSHSHRRTKRRWNPNIQRVRALVNGTPDPSERVHVVHPCGPGHQAAAPPAHRPLVLTPSPEPALTKRPVSPRSGLAKLWVQPGLLRRSIQRPRSRCSQPAAGSGSVPKRRTAGSATHAPIRIGRRSPAASNAPRTASAFRAANTSS